MHLIVCAPAYMLQLLEAFEPNGVSTWVPWRLTPPLLAGLTGALGSAQLVPGENTAWAWVKSGVAMLQVYQPDVSETLRRIFQQDAPQDLDPKGS
jgi:hypothetical protein